MIVAPARLLARLLNSITTSCSITLLPSTQRGAAAAAFAGRRWQQPARAATRATALTPANLAAAVVVSSTAASHSSLALCRSLSSHLRRFRLTMTSATRNEHVAAAATAADKPETSASVVADNDDSRNLFDRSVFDKTLSVPALRVPTQATAALLRSLRGHTLDIPKTPAVIADPADPKKSRLVLLSPEEFNERARKHEEEKTSTIADFLASLPPAARDVAASFNASLAWYDVKFDYSHVSVEEALRRLLPSDVIGDDGPPSSFETVGHIAHLNLRQEHSAYKRIIGRVLLDKNPRLRVVVNKVGSIENEFRVFEMEVIAKNGGGKNDNNESDTVAEVSQHGCRFSLDYSKVYWNSRLEAEHARLVETEFKPGEVVVDAMAGVGPFAIPAAKLVAGCVVYANDLNPESTRWLSHNARRNKVADKVRASCCDAREFIRAFGGVDKRAWESVFGGGDGGGEGEASATAPPPTTTMPTAARADGEQQQKRQLPNPPAALNPPPAPPKTGLRYHHVVMNLPATAIEFLDAFAGSLSPELYPSKGNGDGEPPPKLPRVHVYCFERAGEPPETTLARVAGKLGGAPEEASVRLVRDVSPNKRMMCVSFTLPRGVAVAAVVEQGAPCPSAAKRQKV